MEISKFFFLILDTSSKTVIIDFNHVFRMDYTAVMVSNKPHQSLVLSDITACLVLLSNNTIQIPLIHPRICRAPFKSPSQRLGLVLG